MAHVTSVELRLDIGLVSGFAALFLLACGAGSGDPNPTQNSGGASVGGTSPTASGGSDASVGGPAGGAGVSGSSGTTTGGSSGGGAAGASGSNAVGGSSGASGSGGTAGTGPTKDPVTDLEVGVWTDVTPEGSLDATGVYHMGIAPSDPAIVYLSSDKEGMYRTTDASKTWVRLGNPDGYFTDGTTDYLEDPCNIAVDPSDPDHVYATEGVDGGRQGFWISTDGGNTWAIPQGFKDVATAVGGGGYDVVQMSVDAGDFDHLIVSPHSDWGITAGYSSGIFESTDGGESFSYHLPPGDAWAAGSKGVHILHHPASSTGDGNTWLVCDEGAGFWRTTNAGDDWTHVSDAAGPHGGNQSYYTPEGVFYVGASYGRVWRSTDNGVTFVSLDALPYSHYRAVYGANGLIYTRNVADGDPSPFKTSPEDDGLTWSDDTAEGLTSGFTWEMGFDPVNQILYTANTSGGFWALRVK